MNRKSLSVLLFTLGVAFLISCEKESRINQNPNKENISERIIQFKNKMVSLQKSSESMQFEDAMLLLEGAFNFFYGHPNENYSEDKTDSIRINVIYGNGDSIPCNELQLLYKSLNNKIYDAFVMCEYPIKHLKYIDISLKQSDETSFIEAFLCFGNVENSKKNVSSSTTDDIWLNATPFNEYQGQTWQITWELWSYNQFVYETDGPVAEALNSKLTVPNENSNTFIYRVENTGWMDNPIQNLQELYISNPDIASPEIDIVCDVNRNQNFYFIGGFFNYYFGDFLWCNTTTMEFNTLVDYKLMNKYYNVCMAAVYMHKPADKEPIDIEYATLIWETMDYATKGRWLTGVVKITYAAKVKYKEYEYQLCSDPYKM